MRMTLKKEKITTIDIKSHLARILSLMRIRKTLVLSNNLHSQ